MRAKRVHEKDIRAKDEEIGSERKQKTDGAVVVAQLVEARGSNPVIVKIYIEQCFLSTALKRRK